MENVPNIILSDVMMPEMDGYELCDRIKKEEATSHIPFILLTALKSPKHELQGLSHGADDHLGKPINSGILKQKIVNLLESRKRLQ